MLNTIFIVWLFRIEGAGNLHLPVAKINLYYGEKGKKGWYCKNYRDGNSLHNEYNDFVK